MFHSILILMLTKLTEAKALREVSVTLTGDESIDDFTHVVEQLQLQQPQDRA